MATQTAPTETTPASEDVTSAASTPAADKNGKHETEAAASVPSAKKAKMDDSAAAAEERDFDEETQKALEEIDANQNEIDMLNEKVSWLTEGFFAYDMHAL